ncbi:MAG: Ig domain-containing protein [Candidatus Ornithomonoglobus sp.]
MKIKKLLSLITAAAISASCFVGMAVSASAAGTSTNTDYVEWFFNGATLTTTDATSVDSYRTVSSSAAEALGENLPSMVNNTGYSTADVKNVAVTTPHNEHASSSTAIKVVKSSNNASRHLDITNAFPTNSAYESYDLITVVGSNATTAANHDITVYNAADDTQLAKQTVNIPASSESPIEVKFKDLTATSIYITYTASQSRIFAVTLDYNIPSIDPEISLDITTLTLPTGATQKLTATTENAPETATIAWSSSNEAVATVAEDGTVTTLTEGETTITAALMDSETQLVSASCVLTVKDTGNVTATLSGATSKITLSGDEDYEFTTSETIAVKPGTYTVSAVNAAPVTYNVTLDKTELTVAAGQDYTVATTQSVIGADLAATNNYEAMYDATVRFDIKNGVPASSRYIALEGAAIANLETDTEGVYINVDSTNKSGYTKDGVTTTNNGKFYSVGRDNAQVRHEVTYINVPVVKGSVITIEKNTGDGFAVLGTTDIVTEYTYTGETEGVVTFYVPSTTGDTYLNGITITSPAKQPTSLTGTVTALEDGTFSGDAYEGSAKAFTVSFSPAGKTIKAVKVASKADPTQFVEKTITTTIETTGEVVFGIITTNAGATASDYDVTATIE